MAVKNRETRGDQSNAGYHGNGHQEWDYMEFGYRCEIWKRFYRAIYTRPYYTGEQRLLYFTRPDNIILTNIGINDKDLAGCSKEMRNELTTLESIISKGGQIILKVTQAVMDTLKFDKLWERCNNPVPLSLVYRLMIRQRKLLSDTLDEFVVIADINRFQVLKFGRNIVSQVFVIAGKAVCVRKSCPIVVPFTLSKR